MKLLLSLFLLSLFFQLSVSAQTGNIKTRNVRFNFINKDSVSVPFNDSFYLIEDDCSTITRYGHLDRQKHVFIGPFKDVSHADPTVMITEGRYNADGLKDGAFTCNFPNGKLQAKGNFVNGQYDGKWELYYADGKPHMLFEANAGVISITDAWEANGKKIVDNGKGTFQTAGDLVFWRGKLLKGKPNGDWRLYRIVNSDEKEMSVETFKDGAFKSGVGPLGEYPASRMVLVNTDILPFTRAEHLYVSQQACGEAAPAKVVNAHYKDGFESFSQEIIQAVNPYVSKIDIRLFEYTLAIEGEVSEYGAIVKMNVENNTTVDQTFAHGIITRLMQLPALIPATVDGKITRQKIMLLFTFSKGYYKFNYKLLPIELKK